MKIVLPSVEITFPSYDDPVLYCIEQAGRTCYRSQDKITPKSAEEFCRMLIRKGHESVLEHQSITFRIVCDRGIMAELTRHRLCSFCVESTRYVDSKDEITVVSPEAYMTPMQFNVWRDTMGVLELTYRSLRKGGLPPQMARSVLPNSLATTITLTANVREVRTILRQRLAKAAHPQMQEVARMMLVQCFTRWPVLFEDIVVKG